ncbi:MAG TPA: DUF1329 domain-containing protein [Candidatus Dormibacteraeota bacterium]|nr:DUF1329 domain-containing protein [Candidatus Dormibacteraeota bacterium]
MTLRRQLAALCGAFALAALAAAPARADVQPGDVINKDNKDKVTDLISPGVMWCVDHGMTMKIVPYQKIDWNPAYKEATEKYSGQVKLSADGRTIENHVGGLPFPNIDPNDPNVALKIMFNYEYKPYVTDDQDLRNFDADTGTVSDKPLDVERHYILDHLRTLFYTGRLYVDPKPVLLPNSDGVRAKQSLHPILEPFDLKGVGLTGIRYLDPDRQDDTWLYLPTLRRVRRLSSAQRSDALFGQDTDVDSYGGYAGQIPWFTWKFLGSKKILGTFHAEKFPVEYCPGGADFVYCDNWEPRDVWVLEGVAKQAQYAYGKRVLFIDKETYYISYSDIYDKAGQLWKVWINQYGFRNKAAPGYGDTYDSVMPFAHSITMADIQLSHATRAALPSSKYPGEQGWYFNQGAKTGLTEEFFTIAHMISASN